MSFKKLFSEKDIKDIEPVLACCSISMSYEMNTVFNKIVSKREVNVDELDKIIEYNYSANNYEKVLYNFVKKMYQYISRKYGTEWEEGNSYGNVIEQHIYKDGEYFQFGYHDLNYKRTDGKLQIAILLDPKPKEKENFDGYMTIKIAEKIVRKYYGDWSIESVKRLKTKPGRKPIYLVIFKSGKQLKLKKEDLLGMKIFQ